MHPLVDVLAQLRDGRLRDTSHAHRLHQLIDLAGRNAGNPRFLDDGDKRLLHRLPRLQDAGKAGPAAHLRDLQVQRAQPRVEGALALAVAPGLAGLTPFIAASADQAVDIGLHDQLQDALGNGAQKIGIAALRGKLGER